MDFFLIVGAEMVSRCLKRPQMSREGVPPARKPFKERFRAPRARKVENIVQNALICTILVVPTGDNVGNYCSKMRPFLLFQLFQKTKFYVPCYKF